MVDSCIYKGIILSNHNEDLLIVAKPIECKVEY